MPLKKIVFKPGVNRENTRYTTEGGWYDCDKIRFRQGTPEKIGGWARWSPNTFLGVCRAMWPWASLAGTTYIGMGTHLKYYIADYAGVYNDITPIRATNSPLTNNPFSTTNGSNIVTVTDASHGAYTDDFVTFSGAATVAGLDLNHNYQITVLNSTTYTITASSNANATTTGGGAAVAAAYEVHAGSDIVVPGTGWGAGYFDYNSWDGLGIVYPGGGFRIWVHGNFGEDLIFGFRGGSPFYWTASLGTNTRGVYLSSLSGASDVPLFQNNIVVSDFSRIVLFFGTNNIGDAVIDPMLIRWSDQENAVMWTPSATNQAGDIRLSHGSIIVKAIQVRQEILVFTDTSIYSMQYVGPPAVWSTQLLADNTTIISDRAVITVNNVTYWMGNKKFYAYDGRVTTLVCDLRGYIFNDFNFEQAGQVFASSIEEFNEIWWFYPSKDSTRIDSYVVYNYVERAWYYGSMARTAWLDVNVTSQHPQAATYDGTTLIHEYGQDDLSTNSPQPISAYILSSEFDIDDGHHFGFIWRVIPDISFSGSSVSAPRAFMQLIPLTNSGSGYGDSVGDSSGGYITQGISVPVETFTGQINVRVRGRQLVFKVSSADLGVQWQLGAPRIDIRPDGRR